MAETNMQKRQYLVTTMIDDLGDQTILLMIARAVKDYSALAANDQIFDSLKNIVFNLYEKHNGLTEVIEKIEAIDIKAVNYRLFSDFLYTCSFFDRVRYIADLVRDDRVRYALGFMIDEYRKPFNPETFTANFETKGTGLRPYGDKKLQARIEPYINRYGITSDHDSVKLGESLTYRATDRDGHAVTVWQCVIVGSEKINKIEDLKPGQTAKSFRTCDHVPPRAIVWQVATRTGETSIVDRKYFLEITNAFLEVIERQSNGSNVLGLPKE